ncbi:hypothetical protein [Mesoplasma tabanidae]|uniref:Uncharacterized protein n=1 Tax=Mesoplasma tabanidae TaxID=219745 RepID=A0A2K8P465_9MOLU|nr:hypothetical protein [Mesoplasma tabanidae]ATZ21539.1 hypothetical protein MTABA_v1c03360 [Mesoplasma tabanidae]
MLAYKVSIFILSINYWLFETFKKRKDIKYNEKLLSLLAPVTLTVTSASAVISCRTDKPGKTNLVDLATIELDIQISNKINEMIF